jgi:3-oxoacyl-(acyl-carrier-protein) synthase
VVKPEFQDNPEAASRPFDIDRCGFLYSHGAATLIIEDLDTALKRGAPIYAEILGVSANANANHLPMPGSKNQERVMKSVLTNAGIRPEQVDYVNCHATGTPSGDLQEVRAIQQTFGDHTRKLKINAPKSMLGHTCWASPLVETIGGILQMQNGVLHPTINIKEADPEIKMDICANEAVDYKVTYMLKNSFGFGGLNCCSLIKKYEE